MSDPSDGVLPPDLGDHGDGERVSESTDHCEHDDGDHRRAQLADEGVLRLPAGDDDVDQFDADERDEIPPTP